MTIGGAGAFDAFDSVELYNWETGQSCFIEPVPEVNFEIEISLWILSPTLFLKLVQVLIFAMEANKSNLT